MSASEKNSTVIPLLANTQFTGVSEDVGAFGSYTIALRTSTDIRLRILQGGALNRWDDVRIVNPAAMLPPTLNTDTSPVIYSGLLKMKYFKIEVLNNTANNQTFLRVDTVFRDAMPLNLLDDSIAAGGIDENGNRHLLSVTPAGVLRTDTNVTLEGITLDPATDGIKIYGSTALNGADPLLINTDTAGRLNANMIGSSDGTDRIIMKTQTDGTLNTISPTADVLASALNTLLVENNSLLSKLEINANQVPITFQDINVGINGTPVQFAAGQVISSVVDMGTGADRNNDICFSGHAIIGAEGTGYDDPSVILQFSVNQADWFGDGTAASYYKEAATAWQFALQRNNVGLRYVRLLCVKPIQLNLLISTKFKN